MTNDTSYRNGAWTLAMVVLSLASLAPMLARAQDDRRVCTARINAAADAPTALPSCLASGPGEHTAAIASRTVVSAVAMECELPCDAVSWIHSAAASLSAVPDASLGVVPIDPDTARSIGLTAQRADLRLAKVPTPTNVLFIAVGSHAQVSMACQLVIRVHEAGPGRALRVLLAERSRAALQAAVATWGAHFVVGGEAAEWKSGRLRASASTALRYLVTSRHVYLVYSPWAIPRTGNPPPPSTRIACRVCGADNFGLVCPECSMPTPAGP